jgi:hypothetical protein
MIERSPGGELVLFGDNIRIYPVPRISYCGHPGIRISIKNEQGGWNRGPDIPLPDRAAVAEFMKAVGEARSRLDQPGDAANSSKS